MNIRGAETKDACVIQKLIAQLGYTHPFGFIEAKLQKLLLSDNDLVLVYENEEQVVGLITLHFSVQLAFEGDIMTIGYLVVDEDCRGEGVGKALEEYATDIAKQNKCSLIEVFSLKKRADAHRFYIRQGYKVAEKLFSKSFG